MLENKIYQNFIKEIFKTFLVILFGLTIIAWTVRAVNFLDLIVENGYSITTYFQYSLLNIFAILSKFIPLSFLLALIIFIIKQIQENELIILWTSGVKKIKIVNLFFITSIFILFFYIFFSVYLTPLALNKSRNILSKTGFDSFLPTVRVQQFNDSFKGFTFLIEKRVDNEIKNVFLHDSSNIFNNLTTDQSENDSVSIMAQEGIVQGKQMLLFNGQIISSKKDKSENKGIKFEQLNIDLNKLQTDTIKQPKLQETSTTTLIKCIFSLNKASVFKCEKKDKSEIITNLNRRIFLPFYIPVISLLCSLLLIKNVKRNNLFLNKYSIFFICFVILLYAELIIRYTGFSKIIAFIFILTPLILTPVIYLFLVYKLSREAIIK
tara:strand:- start:371 stop:1507 length:1137 start_codon:yes stop_codon:yes gene_type:complete